MNKTVTSDFGNFVLMTNMVEAPALYSIMELKESAGGTTVGKTRVINVAYDSGPLASNSTTSVYRANIIDTQFYTRITTTGNATGTQGDYVVGATSGATGFLAAAVSSSNFTFLYGTNGTFVAGEVLKANNSSGSTYATIAAGGVRTYGFGDIKQYAYNTNGTSDAVLDVRLSLIHI